MLRNITFIAFAIFTGVVVVIACIYGLNSLLVAYHDPEIKFYGKVVDQNGKPVPGAKVDIAIGYYIGQHGSFDKGTSGASLYITRDTDLDGRFSIENQKGNALYIKRIEFPDFLTLPDDKTMSDYKAFGYNYLSSEESSIYHPDAQKPAVFSLRKVDEIRVLPHDRGGKIARPN